MFKDIFKGLEVAYGTYKIESNNTDEGKKSGKAVVIRKPPTDELWDKHLQGVEPSLGIIPIRSDNSCVWGCIDIDQYPLDHSALVKKIKQLDLPLVVCRSKSGGAHCFLFVKEPIPAIEMQNYLKASASFLGEAGREIFPKQSEILVDRGDIGNFLNLPYFGGDDTTRYAFLENGDSASLEEFYEIYKQNVQDVPLKLPQAPQAVEEPIKDGPPCLKILCQQGFPEGTRNNGLFAIGVYLKKRFEKWEDKLLEYNHKFFNPPLGMNELQTVLKQLQKKEYFYKCKDLPLKSFCNASLCRTKKFGVGANAPDAPQLQCLSKYASEPPLFFLDVNGKRVELDTDQLYNQNLFQKACIEQLSVLPPSLKKGDWESMINELLKEMVDTGQIVEATEDMSLTGRFVDLLEEFTTHLQQALEREEILMGRPYHDDDGKVYFRVKDLETHLKRSNFTGLTAPRMAQRLRELHGEPISLSLKGRATRCWRVPKFLKQDAPFDVAKTDTSIPF